MRCPYCQQATFTGDAACRSCGFSATMADQMFGVVPTLQPGINDLSAVLSDSDSRKLRYEIADIEKEFPQVKASVVTSRLAQGAALQPYLFWLLNRTGICPPIHRGGSNRSLLLLIDTEGQRAGLSIGYGLEPFVKEAALDAALHAGDSAFAKGKLTDGARNILRACHEMIGETWDTLETTFGLDMNLLDRAESTRIGIQPETGGVAAGSRQAADY